MSGYSLDNSHPHADLPAIWIFGYGSLCWNPGFAYKRSSIGYVRGWSRKFWQGSQWHRGTKTQPGRVVTLIEDNTESVVWGVALEVASECAAFPYLQKRECSNGGYRLKTIKFYPNGDEKCAPIEALTFIAFPDNNNWLGEAPLTRISEEIATRVGASGHNAEYLLKLTEYLRKNVPQEFDTELFELEKLVLIELQKRRIQVAEVMNSLHNAIPGQITNLSLEDELQSSSTTSSSSSPSTQQSRRSSVTNNDDFTRRVPDKKLRCVNI